MPSAHGDADRTDGDVTVQQQNSRYNARKTVTVVNGAGDASASTLSMATSSGDIHVETWDCDGYLLTAALVGQGQTEQQARDALATIDLVHSDGLSAGTLALSFSIERDPTAITQIVSVNGGNGASGSLTLFTPDLSYDASADASSGDIRFEAIKGTSLDLGTSSGDIHVEDVRFDRFVASASSGDVTARLAVGSIDVETSSGDITIEASPTRTGTFTIEASSGEVDLELAIGGDIDIDLPDTSPVGEQEDDHAHARTHGFDQRSIQTTVGIITSSGDIDVEAL